MFLSVFRIRSYAQRIPLRLRKSSLFRSQDNGRWIPAFVGIMISLILIEYSRSERQNRATKPASSGVKEDLERARAALVRSFGSLKLAHEPELLPPVELMRTEGPDVLEEWFRWAEEWSMLLRIYGRIRRDSAVLEIGCGLGRIAFPLRYVLSARGTYDGFEICEPKVRFLNEAFAPKYQNFRFKWADLKNTWYNPRGSHDAASYTFEYPDEDFDVIFAASVFTHTLPGVTARYFKEIRRVMRPDGRAVLSFFLLDNYQRGRQRPHFFAGSNFDFDHAYGEFGDRFAISNPRNPEEMTAYRLDFLRAMAEDADLELVEEPLPGFWSAASPTWVGIQDVLVLGRRS